MQYLALFSCLLAAAAASPVDVVESRQTAPAAKCADWGTGFGGSPLLGATDANASRCCIYGESTALCCRNDPALAADPYWKNALECSSPYWASATTFSRLYVCNVDSARFCTALCEDVPWLYDSPKNCTK
ncbi:hypothetical protein PG999_014096 [Apiospora kogelbergensis]|uniref:Secreted protein n=1 Tax=Apiospora kogelbergensis TaxID=1337665 RepID=A0AAW0QBY2_9PEZI